MSNKKVKKHVGFRVEEETLERIEELLKKDPLIFRSKAEIVDAALHYFVFLNKADQKQIISKFLTKNL
jgi:hypothetical protein